VARGAAARVDGGQPEVHRGLQRHVSASANDT
jgi:hypothetical protein